MNRKVFVFSVMGAMLLLCSSVFANSIDYVSNLSASFLMNQSRNAATDCADIVAYNPAGTALMTPGFYVSVSNQTILTRHDETFEYPITGFDESYKNRETIPLLPHAYMVYNMGNAGVGNLALSLKGGVIASGGKLDWNGNTGLAAAAFSVAKGINSNPLTASYVTLPTSTDIKHHTVSSAYYGMNGNIAYSLFENKVSLSAGAQAILAEDSSDVQGKLNFNTSAFGPGAAWNLDINSKWEREAKGYNFIFGLDLRPVEKLTIGLRYETEAALEFEYSQKENIVTPSITNLVTSGAADLVKKSLDMDGEKSNYNLPSVFACGLEYQLTPEVTVATGGTFYFLNSADMDGMEKEWKDVGYEANAGITWAVIPSTLKLGTGVTYAVVGGKDSLKESEVKEDLFNQSSKGLTNDIILVGLGLTYTVMPNLDLTASYAYLATLGKEEATTSSGFDVSYERKLHLIGLEVSYKFF